MDRTTQRRYPAHIQNVGPISGLWWSIVSIAWSSHLIRHRVFRKGQRAATKMVQRIRYLPYEQKLLHLGVITLQKRRTRGELIETYTRSWQEGRQLTENSSASCQLVTTTWENTAWSCRNSEPVLTFFFQSACDKRGEAAIPQDVVDGTSVTPVQELSGQVLAKIWALKSWLNKYISTELSNALHDMWLWCHANFSRCAGWKETRRLAVIVVVQ